MAPAVCFPATSQQALKSLSRRRVSVHVMNDIALPRQRLSDSPPRLLWRMARDALAGGRWRARMPLLGLLGATALLYLWALGASGWANSYYSAAVQAGTVSWKAFLFGSFDASNFITVDKPPAALWVMELSARLFGVNAWSILVPQALEGVAAVALLYATVRRHYGCAAGLIAGTVLALTPVAALIFRYNNPDALLVLLLVAAAYSLSRALDAGRTRWLVLAGALVGFGFLAKMLQAFLVIPAFTLVYACAAPVPLRKRVWQIALAGLAVVVAAGWWVALVALWPASDRPYIGGSPDNSILNLIFGYNGFGRLSGNETGSVGGAGGPGGWGPTGWDRMFNTAYGGQISWLIPAALICFGALLALRARAPRVDPQRAMALVWGLWLLVTAAVFSYAQGIIHEYYSVALAPAIGALVGMGAVTLWRQRHALAARLLLAAAVLAATVWSFVLLQRTPTWLPWLGPAVLVLGLLSAAVVVALPLLRTRVALAVASAALLASLAGPTAYSIDSALTPHAGALPLAGPTVLSGARGGPAGGPAGGAVPVGGFAGAPPGGGFGGPPPLGPNGGAFPGGLLNASTPSAALVQTLRHNATSYRWVAAVVGANEAAGYQLATGDPVMAIGGFNGTDPTPSLAQFEQLVRSGAIHYLIMSGGRGVGPGSSSSSSAILAWAQRHYISTTVGGVTLYDLTAQS